MSYADIAAKNRLPESEQPHPDPNLLEGSHTSDSETDLSQSGASDEKIHVVTRDEFEEEQHGLERDVTSPQPRTVRLSEDDAPARLAAEADQQAEQTKQDTKKAAEQTKQETKKAVDNTKKSAENTAQDVKKTAEDTKEEAKKTAEATKQEAKKVANDAGKAAQETKEDLKEKASNAKVEGQKKYEETKKEAKKEYEELSEKARRAYDKLSEEAKQDWAKLSKESKKKWEEAKNSDAGQELQKPEVWGSLLGVVNLAVVGSTIYFAYKNRNKPHWDKRVLSATLLALGGWFGLQGQAEASLNDKGEYTGLDKQKPDKQ